MVLNVYFSTNSFNCSYTVLNKDNTILNSSIFVSFGSKNAKIQIDLISSWLTNYLFNLYPESKLVSLNITALEYNSSFPKFDNCLLPSDNSTASVTFATHPGDKLYFHLFCNRNQVPNLPYISHEIKYGLYVDNKFNLQSVRDTLYFREDGSFPQEYTITQLRLTTFDVFTSYHAKPRIQQASSQPTTHGVSA